MVTHETNALSAPGWIDTHAHLDAAELLGLQGFDFIEKAGAISSTHVDGLAQTHREQQLLMHTLQKATEGVALGVIPAVERANFDTVQALAHGIRWGYGLGIHPMYTPQAAEPDLEVLAAALDAAKADPHLVAVGEIGLDLFVPALKEPTALAKQEAFYRAQLKLARNAGLPVILHVRRSADLLLKHLRQISVQGGIAHAFNGSFAQAKAFIDRGFKLGFGGALTFPHSTQLRTLAKELPLSAIVLETDAPDIPPQWLYRTAAQREAGEPQGINTPSQLPRIAAVLAGLRGIRIKELQAATWANAMDALPKLKALA